MQLDSLTFSNILKLIYRQLFKGEMIGDDRSCRDDDEEEDDEKDEKEGYNKN